MKEFFKEALELCDKFDSPKFQMELAQRNFKEFTDKDGKRYWKILRPNPYKPSK